MIFVGQGSNVILVQHTDVGFRVGLGISRFARSVAAPIFVCFCWIFAPNARALLLSVGPSPAKVANNAVESVNLFCAFERRRVSLALQSLVRAAHGRCS